MKKLFAMMIVAAALTTACNDNTHADESKMNDTVAPMSEPAPDTASMPAMDSTAHMTDTTPAK